MHIFGLHAVIRSLLFINTGGGGGGGGGGWWGGGGGVVGGWGGVGGGIMKQAWVGIHVYTAAIAMLSYKCMHIQNLFKSAISNGLNKASIN